MCIEKYGMAAAKASDPELKQLFATYQQQEQQHLQTIQQILNGQIPQMQQGSQGGQQNQQQASQGFSQASGQPNQQDAFLCQDLLSTEKYISGTYDTAVFEFTNPQIRQALNHIQKEEQQHGEGIFNYMNQHGMYQPQ